MVTWGGCLAIECSAPRWRERYWLYLSCGLDGDTAGHMAQEDCEAAALRLFLAEQPAHNYPLPVLP